jgi:ACT domain-containing protein
MLILVYKDKVEHLANSMTKEREESLSTSLESRVMLSNVMMLLSKNVKGSWSACRSYNSGYIVFILY